MQDMSVEEYKQFLATGTRTGKLATIRKDGRPHVVPIWFVLDGDDLVFTTWHETVKAHNLRRDEHVCLCVDDQAPPYSFVMVEGTVSFNDDLEELAMWATRIAARYMGPELAESFGERNSVEGELLLRIHTTHVVAIKNMAD
jgi:PPOX class probable F420-dependent enzyme